MRRIYEHLFVLFPKASLLDHWAAPKRKDPLLLYLVPCKLSHKTKQPICMIPRLDPDFFFSWERDPDPLTNYRSTPRFSPIWRESYSCSYADSRPWLATCYNNVLTINLRFVTSSDILIDLSPRASLQKNVVLQLEVSSSRYEEIGIGNLLSIQIFSGQDLQTCSLLYSTLIVINLHRFRLLSSKLNWREIHINNTLNCIKLKNT